VIALVAAAAALAGLVLVFVGVLLTTYQTLLGQISADRIAQFRSAAWSGFAAFLLGLLSVVVSAAWLVASGGQSFYDVTLAVFFADVLALAIFASVATRILLR
jgi:uncharacterized membrane protein